MMIRTAGVFLLITGLAFLPQGLLADDSAMLTIGSKAPDLDIQHWISDGKGTLKPLSKFQPGKVYVVEFWATWCGPCIASMPHLAEVQTKYAAKGVQIISISDEDLETVEGFLKRPVRGATPAEGQAEPATYAQLTSVYCLTTDPDRSVAIDYMEAAGQNGIPTCFIVGKTGLVEWIGHPMQMDRPLDQIVSDQWDRESFLEQFRKGQERSLLLAKVGGLMRAGKRDEALAAVEDAKKANADDAAYVAMLDRLSLQIQVGPAIELVQKGEVDAGLAELEKLGEQASDEMKVQLRGLKFRVLLSTERTAAAIEFLESIAGQEPVPADELNELAWSVYELARNRAETPATVITAATAAAEKAVATDPENAMVLDTLAHLVHLAGDLDRAVTLQEAAVKNSANAPAANAAQMQQFLDQLHQEKSGQKPSGR